MLFDQVIDKRVSYRKFTDEKVSDEDVNKLLDAANKSPIANGAYDECRLTVIRDKDILSEIVSEYQNLTGKTKDPLFDSNLFILFSSKKDTNARYEDAGCIIENICLKATEMGLGSCYIRGAINSIGKDGKYIEKLSLDEGFYPVSGVVIGHVDSEIPPRKHEIKTDFIV